MFFKIFPKIPEVKERIIKKKIESDDDYIVEPNKTCKTCGKSRLCIKENGEDWECRECYTGLTSEQHQSKMRQIFITAGL